MGIALQTRDDTETRFPEYGYEDDMRRSEDGKHVSEAGYWEKYYENGDFIYEWNNGYLEEKPVSDFANASASEWLKDVIRRYFGTHRNGKITNPEFGFRLPLPGKTMIRKLDFEVVMNDKRTALGRRDHSYRGVFDLCAEALSDRSRKDIMRDTVDKKREYEAGGRGNITSSM